MINKNALREELAKALENPDGWYLSPSGCKLISKTTNIELWIGSGRLFFNFPDWKILTFFDKLILWGKVKKLLRAIKLAEITKHNNNHKQKQKGERE